MESISSSTQKQRYTEIELEKDRITKLHFTLLTAVSRKNEMVLLRDAINSDELN